MEINEVEIINFAMYIEDLADEVLKFTKDGNGVMSEEYYRGQAIACHSLLKFYLGNVLNLSWKEVKNRTNKLSRKIESHRE